MSTRMTDIERQHLVRKLQRDLRRFQRIPSSRREAEHADIGEESCHSLLTELETEVTRESLRLAASHMLRAWGWQWTKVDPRGGEHD